MSVTIHDLNYCQLFDFCIFGFCFPIFCWTALLSNLGFLFVGFCVLVLRFTAFREIGSSNLSPYKHSEICEKSNVRCNQVFEF